MFKNMFKRRGDSVQHLAEISKVNAILESGKTLDYLDKTKLLGCKKKVYLDRAVKQGYKYNPLENKFVEIQPRVLQEIVISPPKEIKIEGAIIQYKDAITQDEITHDKDEVTQRNTTQYEVTQDKDEVTQSDTTQDKDITMENILTRLKILEDKVLQSVTSPSCTFILNEKLKDIEIVTRGIKVDKNALKEFDNLASTKLAQFTKQELLSQALLEFVARYK